MDYLTLTAAKMRMVRGETQYNPISRFIREIPDELLDQNVSYAKRGNFSAAERLGGKVWSFGGAQDEAEQIFGGGFANFRRSERSDTVFDHKKAAKSGFGTGTKRGDTFSYGKSSVGGREFSVTKASALDYQEGDRVEHARFGEGTVLEIREGKRDFEVTVAFDTAGQKRMFASFAKLVKK